MFIMLALVCDFAIVVAGKHAPMIRQDTLRLFGVLNISLLAIDLGLTLGVQRLGGRLAKPTLYLCATMEAFASIAWVQFTGVLSSYFLFAIVCLVVTYRVGAGYRVGIVALASVVVFHIAAFALESVGILRSSPLFTVAADSLAVSFGLRVIFLLSIEVVFIATFATANFLVWLVDERDVALRIAREELRRALAEGRPGELVGRSIGGRYLLTDFLGRGGMGDVYKATRAGDERAVALKILHFHLGSRPTAVERFRREVEAARRLLGTRVPEVLDSGTTEEGLHFFAMEWLRGEDLASLLRRRERLTLQELQSIADQLAEVLDAAHAVGVVHRDVKPQNVFVVEGEGGTYRIHLLDFGIASLQDDDPNAVGITRTLDVVGTPGYLAPEQVASRFGSVGPPTDVFAMGAVLYRALTGRPAFDLTNERGAAFAALHSSPVPPTRVLAQVSGDVDDVFVLALAKRSADRYQSASELARDLRLAASAALSADSRARARRLTVDAGPPTATQRIEA